MGKDPVAYAEDTLGVHAVYDETRDRLSQHADAKDRYLTALKAVRELKGSMAEREAEITSDERGKNPDMKITAFKQHVAATCEQDSVYAAYADELAAEEANRDTAEQDMRHHELGVRALTARMYELGGLLEFYSAAKRSTNKSN